MREIRILLQEKIKSLIKTHFKIKPPESPLIDYSSDPGFGDMTSKISFPLSSIINIPPQKIAQQLASEISLPFIKKIDIADGYLNFFISNDYFKKECRRIICENRNYGKINLGKGKKIQIEFCSANPTGPLTIAHGRQTVVGDVLSSLFSWAGYDVTREYFVNDSGTQIELLGKSIYARCHGLEIPEEGYHGDYIQDIADKIKSQHSYILSLPQEQACQQMQEIGVEFLMQDIKKTLQRIQTRFDVFTSQKYLEQCGKVSDLIKLAQQKELCYQKDNAIWIRTSEFGDDKDRVLVKSDGSFTYRAVDLAYHIDKFNRGFETVINLWGPDHHAHVAGMKIALKSLGFSQIDDILKVIIVQHCTLYRGKEKVKISKRAATYITLDELLDEVGKDATRFFFLTRNTDTHLDFDIEIATKKSLDNPVFYVQYAHARICSVFKKGIQAGLIKHPLEDGLYTAEVNLDLVQEEEIKLIKQLCKFEDVIETAIMRLEPQVLVSYLYQIASEFQKYYQLGDKDPKFRILCNNQGIRDMRLFVISAVKVVLRNCLSLLGVDAPEYMQPLET